jgi:dihydroxyacetone kinase
LIVVGDGLLAASVSGDIFASPSARQVLGAIKAVPSSKGTILLITNYTGQLHHLYLYSHQSAHLAVALSPQATAFISTSLNLKPEPRD